MAANAAPRDETEQGIEQGIFCREQGILLREQGIFFARAGKFFGEQETDCGAPSGAPSRLKRPGQPGTAAVAGRG
jgi:hypothetical protein